LFTSGAIFRNSTLVNVHFDESKLGGASFAGSTIEDTSFKQAYLFNSAFDRVNLCQNVNFTDADVFNASFSGAKFSKDAIPIFVDSAWWQATGWDFGQIELLAEHFDKKDIQKSKKFMTEPAFSQNDISSQDVFARAMALNKKAWTLAIYGVVADGAAESAVREAVQLVGQSEYRHDREIAASFNDTLAYILMQEPDPKKQESSLTEALRLFTDSAESLSKGQLFRYAIALHASNQHQNVDAILQKALIKQQHEPSHEFYLLKRYFVDELKARYAKITGRGPSGPPDCSKTK
jgi:hypothetical protein